MHEVMLIFIREGEERLIQKKRIGRGIQRDNALSRCTSFITCVRLLS